MDTKARKIGGALYVLIPQKEVKARKLTTGKIEIYFKEDKLKSDLDEIKKLIQASKTDHDYIADKVSTAILSKMRS